MTMEVNIFESAQGLLLTPGILLGLGAIILSIIAMANSRKNSRQVMAKIDKVKREVGLKSSLNRLATVVSDMVDSLNWNLDIKMFSFRPIQIATDEVIRFIHDKGERESVLNAEAVSIRISFSNGVGREETGKIETVNEFERIPGPAASRTWNLAAVPFE